MACELTDETPGCLMAVPAMVAAAMPLLAAALAKRTVERAVPRSVAETEPVLVPDEPQP